VGPDIQFINSVKEVRSERKKKVQEKVGPILGHGMKQREKHSQSVPPALTGRV